MEMNARMIGLLSLLVAGGLLIASVLTSKPYPVSFKPLPVAPFSAPVAEGGRLFMSIEEALLPAQPSVEATLVIDETITPIVAGRILALPDASLALVELDTVGGDVQSAIAIGNRLRAAKSHTHVAAGAKCFSACGVIYQGGVVRSADEQALFLLHYAVQQSNDPGRARVGSIWGTVALIEAMIDLGVDPEIYDQMPGFGDWLLSAAQARELGLVQFVGTPREVRRQVHQGQATSVSAWTSWGRS